MERKALRVFVVLALLSISGIVVVQVYWFRQAFDVEQKNFEEQVTHALSSVHKRVLNYQQLDASILKPVQQVSPGYYVVNISEEVAPSVLKELLKQEFSRHHVEHDFELGMYNCSEKDISYKQYVCLSEECDPHQLASFPFSSSGIDHNYFGIYFPNRITSVVSNMDIWLFSSAVIFIVLLFFFYSLFFILKQKKLSEIQADFIKNMAHEFKTPISTVAISSKVLMESEASASAERLSTYAEIIHRENGRLEAQVEKVLQLLTVNKSSQQLQFEEVNVVEIVGELEKSAQAAQLGTGFSIEVDCTEKAVIIWADKLHFSNILHNLLDNAVKYRGEAPPQIVVGIRCIDKKAQVTIKDNGLGIAPDQQKKIFDKFYRISTGDVHNVKGFGLGLSYVKKMVKAHGGKISLKSELRKGSEFILYFDRKA
ncbi:HAMP domain-containing sensor histidine kinase [Flammeovirgaceae bacterium SG7u.111]|nr:HAMP domain-containing sensor histidine kinase [Flammeovirgaceae bacterium SG7u.132]WPO34707.1 HAMP domain-containing sensor histidine kinase [Flammeovirgaceae bacterium SG7u.111]